MGGPRPSPRPVAGPRLGRPSQAASDHPIRSSTEAATSCGDRSSLSMRTSSSSRSIQGLLERGHDRQMGVEQPAVVTLAEPFLREVGRSDNSDDNNRRPDDLPDRCEGRRRDDGSVITICWNLRRDEDSGQIVLAGCLFGASRSAPRVSRNEPPAKVIEIDDDDRPAGTGQDLADSAAIVVLPVATPPVNSSTRSDHSRVPPSIPPGSPVAVAVRSDPRQELATSRGPCGNAGGPWENR